jgi:hypothetical protein
MKTKTQELTGAALDWAVAKCEGIAVEYIDDGITQCLLQTQGGRYAPSINWSQGGPIIERELIRLDTACNYTDGKWKARIDSVGGWWPGETPLIAAMRCFVESKLGNEVYIPEELL